MFLVVCVYVLKRGWLASLSIEKAKLVNIYSLFYNLIMEDKNLLLDVEKLFNSLGALPEAVDKPVFIVVSGLPGTGKSYFSQRLAERLPVVILESDALRRVLYPVPDYSQQESAHLFRATHLLIEKLLKRGISLILDATNLAERHREWLYHIAERVKAKLIMVRVEAPPHLVRERLKSRPGEANSISDADWEVYRKMRQSVETIRRRHYVADTSRDISPVIDKIVKEVNR